MGTILIVIFGAHPRRRTAHLAHSKNWGILSSGGIGLILLILIILLLMGRI